MGVHDIPQKPAIRSFQALLDSLDQPHDPEYHWLWNERRHPGHQSDAQARSPEHNRRITDHPYGETD